MNTQRFDAALMLCVLIGLVAVPSGIIAAYRHDNAWVAAGMGVLAVTVIAAVLTARARDKAIDQAVLDRLGGRQYDPSEDLATDLGIRPGTLRLSLHRLRTRRDA
ncbi:hypothetical protein [Streptacidiphilus sp. MAP5-52]|uniref:hypothetical protein n=1 Tax=Streptacidiphilus sp. MAP5-52 TaxID=3156267 RepID=UPI003518779E